MNYWGFQAPVLEWLHGLEFRSHASGVILRTERASTASMVETLTAFRAAIAWDVARHQFNLLDSHDTARIASMLDGDPGRVRAALGFLLTYVGVPSILYGDEIGLEGVDDLMARRPMPWDQRRLGRGPPRVRTLDGASAGRIRPPCAMAGSRCWSRDRTGSPSCAIPTTSRPSSIVVRGPGARPAAPLGVAHGGIPDGTRFREHLTGAEATVVGGRLAIPETPTGIAVWLTGAT